MNREIGFEDEDLDSSLGLSRCQSGWVSITDYQITDTSKCIINRKAVDLLCIADICFSTAVAFAVIRYLWIRRNEKKRAASCCFVSLRKLCPFVFFLTAISSFALSYLRLLDNKIIGIDPGISFLQTAHCILCFFSTAIYYQNLLNFLKGYSKIMSPSGRNFILSRFTFLSASCWLTIPLSLAPSSIPLFVLFYPSKMRELCSGSLIGTSCMVFIFGTLFVTALGLLTNELSPYVAQSKYAAALDLHLVCKRMKMAYWASMFLMFGTSICMIAFALTDYLLARVTYLFIIIRISVMTLYLLLMVTLSKIEPLFRQRRPSAQATMVMPLNLPPVDKSGALV